MNSVITTIFAILLITPVGVINCAVSKASDNSTTGNLTNGCAIEQGDHKVVKNELASPTVRNISVLVNRETFDLARVK